MSFRDYYFSSLTRASATLASFSRSKSAQAFARLHVLARLLDLRSAASDAPTIDQAGSGLPILKEVISVANDIAHGIAGGRRDPAEIRAAMLEEMLGRRRMPEERLTAAMARSLYASALDADGSQAFRPDAGDMDLVSERDALRAAWDFWDGRANHAVRVYAEFAPDADPDQSSVETLRTVANTFSGGSYTLASLACEIDERIQDLRLKKISKVTVGPFLTPFFERIEDPLAQAVRESDLEDAWALRWTVDRLKSDGTCVVGKGLFGKGRFQERFRVDTLDPDCAARGVTSFDSHVLMPHELYQRLADGPEAAAIPTLRMHVLTPAGGLIENA